MTGLNKGDFSDIKGIEGIEFLAESIQVDPIVWAAEHKKCFALVVNDVDKKKTILAYARTPEYNDAIGYISLRLDWTKVFVNDLDEEGVDSIDGFDYV